jgi:hypothetical protein
MLGQDYLQPGIHPGPGLFATEPGLSATGPAIIRSGQDYLQLTDKKKGYFLPTVHGRVLDAPRPLW